MIIVWLQRVAGLSDGDLSPQPCRLSHIGSLQLGIDGRGEGEGLYLNQPVMPALRLTCQQPTNSRFHSLLLSGSSFPSLPLLLYLSSLIYLPASHPLHSFTSLLLRHKKQITLTWADVSASPSLSLFLSQTVIFTSQQVIGNSFGHRTQGDYLSWQLLIWLKNSNKLWRIT